jgi:hypothetical protein
MAMRIHSGQQTIRHRPSGMGRLGVLRLLALLILPISTIATPSQPGSAPSEAGWEQVVTALLAGFDRYDVIALGEGHGRFEDRELQLRVVRSSRFEQLVDAVVVESADSPAAIAVVDLARQTRFSAPRLIVGAGLHSSAVAAALSKGRKSLVIYGSGHVWRKGGELTAALAANGYRVLVVLSLAPPTPTTTLARVDRLAPSAMRPVLLPLANSPVGRIVARDVFQNEPISPIDTLSDLADLAVHFGGAADTVANPSPSPALTQVPGSSIEWTGTVAGVVRRTGGLVYVILEVADGARGRKDRWAVRCAPETELAKRGWGFGTGGPVRLGDTVTVVGEIPGADARPTRLVDDAPVSVQTLAKEGRVLNGKTLKLASAAVIDITVR